MAAPTLEQISRAPKVLLHDHLDGGLRPTTVVELARESGHTLPTSDPDELARWLTEGAHRHDLDLYLETFEHTVGVMQTKDALVRVAAECAEDLADDGVVYAEVRFAPELHINGGLTLDEVVEAVLEGFRLGSAGRRIVIGTLATAMRHAANSLEIAELALRHRDDGVVGFDIAGSEAGNPPTRHLAAFQEIAKANSHITIHAGEAFGLPSIWEALQICGAERLGHGVRIVDDITLRRRGSRPARPAGRLRARPPGGAGDVPDLERAHRSRAVDLPEHPIGLLTRLRYRVTVNTDNRLMSDITMSREMHNLVEAFGFGWDEIEWLTINAMKSAFWPFDQRLRIIQGQIKPGYAALRAEEL